MFSRKDNDHAAQQAREIREAEARARASAEASRGVMPTAKVDQMGRPHAATAMEAEKAKRPHEIPPRAFVGNTLKQLNTVSDNYHLELAMLDKDIAKLQEERRQLVIVLDGVKLALDSINKSDSTVSVKSPSPDALVREAQNRSMSRRVSEAAKPPADFDETALREDVERALIDDAAHK